MNLQQHFGWHVIDGIEVILLHAAILVKASGDQAPEPNALS